MPTQNPAGPEEGRLYHLAERHREAGRLREAESIYRELLDRMPRHLAALGALETLLAAASREEEAAAVRAARVRVEAENAYTIGKALVMEGEHERAIPFLERAIALRPDYRKAHRRLGGVFHRLDCYGEALACYRRCLELDPGDVEAGFLIAALGGGAAPPRPPEAYVRNYFDGYAETFDAHLCKSLDYRGPEVLFEYVRRAIGRRNARLEVLDVGCGTGLAGAYFRRLAARLTGVDLSPAMLAKAAARNLYDHLEVSEAVAFLETAPAASFDLVIACDSLVYMGDLEPFLTAAAHVLRPRGLFALSLEKGTTPGFALGPSGRYVHHPDILPALAGERFRLREAGEAVVRLEFGKPVTELIYVLERMPS